MIFRYSGLKCSNDKISNLCIYGKLQIYTRPGQLKLAQWDGAMWTVNMDNPDFNCKTVPSMHRIFVIA